MEEVRIKLEVDDDDGDPMRHKTQYFLVGVEGQQCFYWDGHNIFTQIDLKDEYERDQLRRAWSVIVAVYFGAGYEPVTGDYWIAEVDSETLGYIFYLINTKTKNVCRMKIVEGVLLMRLEPRCGPLYRYFCKMYLALWHRAVNDKASTLSEADYHSFLVCCATKSIMHGERVGSSFTIEECQLLLELFWDLKRQMDDPDVSLDYRLLVLVHRQLFWLMAVVGEEHAKSDIGRKKHEREPLYAKAPEGQRSTNLHLPISSRVINAIISPSVFGMHSRYHSRLLSTRYEGRLRVLEFQKFIRGLLREWSDSNLLATVLVSANVAFLAIPDILNFQKSISIASAVFSLGSILAGVHHSWRHRSLFDIEAEVHPRQGPEYDAINRYFSHLGTDLDAIIHAFVLCLPVVLLIWAALTFIIAISAFAIQETELSVRIVSMSTLGFLAIVALLNLGYFRAIWEGKV